MNPSNEAGGQVPDPGQAPDSVPTMPAMTSPAGQSTNPLASPNGPADPAAAVPPMTLPLPPVVPSDVPPQKSQTMPQTDVSPTTQAANPPVMDDGDLIEKEWVNKAKQIVDKNRNNPHKQSEELTVFRADYMKKRYNKNIKVDE